MICRQENETNLMHGQMKLSLAEPTINLSPLPFFLLAL